MNSLKHACKVTNALRHAKLINKAALGRNKAIKQLTVSRTNKAGRNNSGTVVCYTKGTRSVNRVRCIDHVKQYYNIPCTILRVEYDPTRSAFIAAVKYSSGICNYRLHIFGVVAGNVVLSYVDIQAGARGSVPVRFNLGDSSRLISIPRGTVVNDVERYPGLGGCLARSAGTFCLLIRKFEGIRKCVLKIPSGALLSFSGYSFGTKGIVSNKIHKHRALGKAGRNRGLGRKSIVRGVAMNPVDHPHGGGEGKKSKKCFPRTAGGKMLHWRKTGITYVDVDKNVFATR